jgi:hypothetical protein
MSKRRSKQKRDKLRNEWRQHQKMRALIEGEIAKLEKHGDVSDAQLEDLGLWIPPPPPPAMQFMIDRLSDVSLDDPELDSKWKLGIIDLVKSDIPLDPRSRSLLAGDLQRLYFPNAERNRREQQRMEAAMIDCFEEELLSRGMTTAKAREEIVKALGISSVDALRKRMQRAPK